MTPPQAITLVAVSMAAITAIIGVVQQLHIQSLQSQVKDANKRALNSLRDHANEREVSAKLESDLKQADEAYDLLVKDNADFIKTLTQYSVNLTNAKIGEDKWKAIAKQSESKLKQTELAYDMCAKKSERMLGEKEQANDKYRNLIAMPRRKREKVIAWLKVK
jgi:exonuclease VII large subunit